MNRRRFLGLSALAALGLGLGSRRARASGLDRLLVLWNAGGWDPTFVFDPHEGDGVTGDESATVATAGGVTFADAETRPSVRRFFQRYGDRAVVVNGLSVGSISHEGCTRLLLTGARDEGAPDLATALASATGSALTLPHVVLSGPRYPGALGDAMVPLNATLSGIAAGTLPEGASPDAQRESRLRIYLSDEAARLGTGRAPLAGALGGLERLPDLERAVAELDIPEDPTDASRLALASRLLASGLCRSLTVQVGLPNQCTWDSHYENADNQDRAFENLFDQLVTLLDQLEASDDGGGSLLDRTLVMVLSEMGRSPVLNAAEGKDHWPFTSALLVGGGLSGGRTIGGTDGSGVGQRVDLATGEVYEGGERLTPASLAAGVLGLFEVDSGEVLEGVEALGGLG